MGSQLARATALTVFGSVVAGYGFAMGRDAWRRTKKNVVEILIISVLLFGLFAPFFAARGLVRHHRRGFAGTLFVTIIGNLILWCVGVGILLGTYLFIQTAFGPQIYGGTDMQLIQARFVRAYFPWFALGIIGITFLGLLVGLWERPKRKRAFKIELENDRFLASNGIQETGGHDITHVDGEDNKLRLMEINEKHIVFMAVGRRNRRAYINLGRDGRMVEYTGIVAIA